MLPLYSLDVLGRHLLIQLYLVFLRFLALLRLSSTLPYHAPRLPSLDSGPPHDATVSMRHRVLRLWLLVTRWRRSPSHVFRASTGTGPVVINTALVTGDAYSGSPTFPHTHYYILLYTIIYYIMCDLPPV